MRRANLGCGSIRPEDWDNYDIEDWDIRFRLHECELSAVETGTTACHDDGHCGYVGATYDYIVAHHLLSQLNHHELPGALQSIYAVLKLGGRLRVSEPDIIRGFAALITEDSNWFPQDERTDGLDARFCTWLTWFGTVRSVFTRSYLAQLLYGAGFEYVNEEAAFGVTFDKDPSIMDLDARNGESFYLEAVK